MNYKHNLKYFTGTTLSKLAIVCWIFTAIGAGVLFLRVWALYFIGGAIGVISCVLGFVFVSYSMRDSEYDEICNEQYELFKEKFITDATEAVNRCNLHNKVVASINHDEISFSSNFLFTDTALSKEGSDDKFRTSEMAFTAVLAEKSSLIIAAKTFSLVQDRIQESFNTYSYKAISAASVYAPDDISPLAEYKYIKLDLTNGETVLTVKANDAELDKLVELINTKISQVNN